MIFILLLHTDFPAGYFSGFSAGYSPGYSALSTPCVSAGHPAGYIPDYPGVKPARYSILVATPLGRGLRFQQDPELVYQIGAAAS
jgi:hypothetical protein